MGIHYDYKSTRGTKVMQKQAKREQKLAEKRAKKQAKVGKKNEAVIKIHDVKEPITLEDLTNPDKSK